jgi:hypothetical protein
MYPASPTPAAAAEADNYHLPTPGKPPMKALHADYPAYLRKLYKPLLAATKSHILPAPPRFPPK